jgi:tripartite ATP-independent transporter DctM subunit
MIEFIPLIMFVVVCGLLLLGYPVALTLAGTAISFAALGIIGGIFDPSLLRATPDRLFGIMNNETLIAVPLFVFMGVMLEKSNIAEDLLENMAKAFKTAPGGLGISVVFVGMLLAASTGIVGATVVAMGLMSLPTMLRRGYSPRLATGTICATGTLGQIIPPSITLVLLGDVISNAYQRAQLNMGIFNTDTVSVGDLFLGAMIPGLLLVFLYAAYVFGFALLKPDLAPAIYDEDQPSIAKILGSLAPPLILIFLVLGSIIAGIATPTEAAGVGALGATFLALAKGKVSLGKLKLVMTGTLETTSMVFLILIGASIFSLIFRGYGGEELIQQLFVDMPGGAIGAMAIVMLVIFLLGFILDFIEITFVVVPIVGPVLLMMGIDPVWLGIMIAINLQTSFLTPPFGFALFYLRGVAQDSVATSDIYRGVIPFIGIQLFVLILLAVWPQLATWLPSAL